MRATHSDKTTFSYPAGGNSRISPCAEPQREQSSTKWILIWDEIRTPLLQSEFARRRFHIHVVPVLGFAARAGANRAGPGAETHARARPAAERAPESAR
jgi:hypothetical protein